MALTVTAELVTIAGAVAGGVASGLTAYKAIQWDQRDVRRRLHHGERIFSWLAENFMVLAQSHNEHHPDGKHIDVSGLAKLLFDARSEKDDSVTG